jgi:hypothetical protein
MTVLSPPLLGVLLFWKSVKKVSRRRFTFFVERLEEESG